MFFPSALANILRVTKHVGIGSAEPTRETERMKEVQQTNTTTLVDSQNDVDIQKDTDGQEGIDSGGTRGEQVPNDTLGTDRGGPKSEKTQGSESGCTGRQHSPKEHLEGRQTQQSDKSTLTDRQENSDERCSSLSESGKRRLLPLFLSIAGTHSVQALGHGVYTVLLCLFPLAGNSLHKGGKGVPVSGSYLNYLT